MCMFEAKTSHSQNVDWGFLLSTAFPTIGVITQRHYMFSEGMSSKQTNNNPGFCHVKGQYSGPCT